MSPDYDDAVDPGPWVTFITILLHRTTLPTPHMSSLLACLNHPEQDNSNLGTGDYRRVSAHMRAVGYVRVSTEVQVSEEGQSPRQGLN